nr:protein ROOT PRIMORDIUM DEFECTIVE 1-like [Ipomoea trifida]
MGGGRPKKKIYHRVDELDRVMELQKKPSLILQLKSIIESQRNQSLLLRDLEKEVGFVQKWNFMNVIEKYPTIFYVTCAGAVMLSRKAKEIAVEEGQVRVEMEPILIKNLRKLLMLSVDCRVPLGNIDLIKNELGLPPDYKNSLISKYPEFFSVKSVNGRDYLHLENWDSSLAVTAREERWACERESKLEEAGIKPTRTSKDGNFSGLFAFHVSFPAGFRPNKSYLEEVVRWQKMEFPSPYLNARRFDIADPKARKRVVGVLHELLSLTMEKRLTSAQLEAFHSEYRLPAKLLLCLIKQHGSYSSCYQRNSVSPNQGVPNFHFRPLLAKLDISVSRLAKGLGRSTVRLAMVESLLPNFTVQDGPPAATVASRAATDNTSAQDTIPGQAFSNSRFAASITS